ncbi:MAG: phage tail protein [Acidobacteriota bacterium]|nr:phage tail protein [Acidobacteriota bacterium]
MFKADSRGQKTARFSGIEFVPSTITVRSAGEKGTHLSPVSVNETRYNDFVPLLYGTAWYAPSVVFARNDGNLTRLEILLGVGEMQAVHKVLVNDIDIPIGRSGLNMTGTGWFNVVTPGTRTGAFNSDFANSTGAPLGDPYGGLAVLSVVVPNRINNGNSLPNIKVLADGVKLMTFDLGGLPIGRVFTNNPAWVILDVLLRNGWNSAEIDFSSFAAAAVYCDETIASQDLYGQPVRISRFQCNLILKSRRSAGDVLRGIRNASRLFLTFGTAGRLQLSVENTLALQQPDKRDSSNAKSTLNGGWPAYEFGDGTSGTSGILRLNDGSSSVKLSCRSASDTPNRLSIEFQDAFNEYQQDSFSLTDADDVAKVGQELNSTPNVLGVPNYNQAARILMFNLNKSVQGNLQIEFQTSVKAVGLVPGNIVAITYLREGIQRQPFRIIKIAPGQNFRTATITAQVHDDVWYSDDVEYSNGNGRRLLSANLGLPRPLSGTALNATGGLDFGVVETSSTAVDGATSLFLNLTVVIPPSIPDSAPGIPTISLVPAYSDVGGNLPGGNTFYYSVSGVDKNGNEGSLSFVVRATLPDESTAQTVTLQNLSFSPGTTAFHVYRGSTPVQLARIASSITVDTRFTDTGLPPQAVLPPDPNFSFSNIYWRFETEGEASAVTHSITTIGNQSLQLTTDLYVGYSVRIVSGLGVGQERTVVSNTNAVLTIDPSWDIEPNASSTFVISQTAFHFAATGKGNRFQFEVPNREGVVVQISGRSVNGIGVECPYELSPLTRWKLGGAGIRSVDTAVPSLPGFAVTLPASQGGAVEFAGISFSDLTNTATVVAGTFNLYFYDELQETQPLGLALDVSDTELNLQFDRKALLETGDLLQMDKELVRVEMLNPDGASVSVTRGLFGTAPQSYVAVTPVWILSRKIVIVPFIKNFFGTPASGDWSYTVALECIRLAGCEFFVTNSQGNSPSSVANFTNTRDRGLRTLSGGQYSLQVAGFLAVESSVVPETVLEADHSIRDVFAVVSEAASSGQIVAALNLNSTQLCLLTLAGESKNSNVVNGINLPVLRKGDHLSVDILSVGSGVPGRDLSIIVRI